MTELTTELNSIQPSSIRSQQGAWRIYIYDQRASQHQLLADDLNPGPCIVRLLETLAKTFFSIGTLFFAGSINEITQSSWPRHAACAFLFVAGILKYRQKMNWQSTPKNPLATITQLMVIIISTAFLTSPKMDFIAKSIFGIFWTFAGIILFTAASRESKHQFNAETTPLIPIDINYHRHTHLPILSM